jgi:hypothetical protein
MPRIARWPLALLSLIVGGVATGCGSSGGYAGPGAGVDGGGAAAGHGGTAGGTGGTAGVGGARVSGARVFAGETTLLLNGPACTNEAGAPGDRWCAFLTWTDATANARSLYVVNVSRVGAGVDVACSSGSNADCLLLTADHGADTGSPPLHGTFFQGDTLVYYDAAWTPYAWRPGMTAGRRLATVPTGADAVWCTPAPQGTAVLCVLLLATQADPSIEVADLLIGRADGTSEPLLSVAETLIVASTNDVGFRPRFGFGFPPGPGDHVGWTSADGVNGSATLKLQQAGNGATRLTVASDVYDWTVSPDAGQWFWLATATPAGTPTLRTAPFPNGANPTDVRAGVYDFGLAAPEGRTVVAVVVGDELVAIADPINAPADERVLDTGVRALLSFGAAGHVAYAKQNLGFNSADLYVAKADGTEPCTVEATMPVPSRSVAFTPDGRAIIWARAGDKGFEARYTRLRDCNTMPIATGVTLIVPLGSQRVLFMNAFDDVSVSGTLRARRIVGDTLSAEPPTTIADQVDSYAIAGSDTVLYTVNTGGPNDGVYVRRLAD